jgi:hypothetical protein
MVFRTRGCSNGHFPSLMPPAAAAAAAHLPLQDFKRPCHTHVVEPVPAALPAWFHAMLRQAGLSPAQEAAWLSVVTDLLPKLNDAAFVAGLTTNFTAAQEFINQIGNRGSLDHRAPVNCYAVLRVNGRIHAFPLRGLPLHLLPTHPCDIDCRVGPHSRLGVWTHRRFVNCLQRYLLQPVPDMPNAEEVCSDNLLSINLAALRMLKDWDRLHPVAVSNLFDGGVDEMPSFAMNLPVGPALMYRIARDGQVDTAEYAWDAFVTDWQQHRFKLTAKPHHLDNDDERTFTFIWRQFILYGGKFKELLPALFPDPQLCNSIAYDMRQGCTYVDYRAINGHASSVGHRAADVVLMGMFIQRVLKGVGQAYDWRTDQCPLPLLTLPLPPPVRLRLVRKRHRSSSSNVATPAASVTAFVGAAVEPAH